jgi:hypothetical protein
MDFIFTFSKSKWDKSVNVNYKSVENDPKLKQQLLDRERKYNVKVTSTATNPVYFHRFLRNGMSAHSRRT